MNAEVFELIPFKDLNSLEFIATMALYERQGEPILLTNGAKLYPEGWLRWLKA